MCHKWLKVLAACISQNGILLFSESRHDMDHLTPDTWMYCMGTYNIDDVGNLTE